MQRRFGPIMQNAFVVPDLEAAIDHWARVMHVGPFYVFEHVPFTEIFRGKLTKIDMSAAIAYSGDLQIELIYQHDDAPSIYTELPRGGRSGLQHMGVMTDSVDDDLGAASRASASSPSSTVVRAGARVLPTSAPISIPAA
jgi:hypothetical protein